MAQDRNIQALSSQLQVTLPVDEGAELNVLGTIISHDELFTEVEDVLTSDVFRREDNRSLFRILKYIIKAGNVIDENSVIACAEKFRDKIGVTVDEIRMVLMEAGVCDSPRTFSQDVERLVEYSMRRKAWETLQRMSTKVVTLTDNADETISDTMKKLDEIRNIAANDDGVIDARKAVQLVYDQINDNLQGVNKACIRTGFRFSDAKGGLRLGSVVVIGAWTSVGKALPMDANVLTPNGWVKNKDLYVGQEVCSIDGRKSFVTGIYKRGVREMYNVTFSDGRVVKCCGEHLWEVYHPDWSRPHVFDTLEIKRRQDGIKYHNRMRIPAFSGIFGEKKDFVVPPYVLGVLIGDGCLTKGVTWSKPDAFIAEKIRTMIPSLYYISETTRNDIVSGYRISTKRGQKNPMLDELDRIGLKGKRSYEKFIPKEYLNCCREQRIELLNGLMDTDGYVSNEGHCVYSTSSKMLADDVLYLCHSLGFRASLFEKTPKIGEKEYRKSYNITISSKDDSEIVSLPRKKNKTRKRSRCNIVINSVEYAGMEECQCISVSHERSLYVTDGFIMTHNTALSLNIATNVAMSGVPVAYYSLEMGAVELWSRIVSGSTDISAGKILNYPLKREEVSAIDKTIAGLADMPLYIDDKATTKFSKMIRSVRRMVKKYGIKMFVVDYLQIFSQNSKGGSEESAISAMARECKNICRELNICCLLLSQLRRDKDERHPTIDMLRGSGQIEESADNVVLIDRPEAHPEWGVRSFYGNSSESVDGKAELRVCKGRNIGLGTYYVGFDSQRTQFYELDGYRIGDEIGYDDGNGTPFSRIERDEDSETDSALPF